MHIYIMYEKYFLNRHSEQSYLLQVKENAHLGSSWTYKIQNAIEYQHMNLSKFLLQKS